MLRFQIIACLVLSMMFATTGAEAAWPPSKCTHVKVLGAGDDDEIVEYDNARLENAGPKQLDVLGEALDKMPEVLCQAVRRVAFLYRPPEEDDESAIDAWTNRNEHQDLVYLNTYNYMPWDEDIVDRTPGLRGTAIQRMIHESTHTAIRLIQSQQKAEPYRPRQDRADETLWPANARQLAEDVVKSNRLDSGVIREWQRMHNAFVSAGMAEEYYDKGWKEKVGYSSEYLARAGFMSAYGGEQAIEDIAEMTSWAIVRGAADNPEDGACQVMDSRTESYIEAEDAAVFTKIGFVQSLGFISEPTRKNCAGKLNIAAPGQGFHSLKDGNLDRSYTGNMSGALGRSEDKGPIMFSISADGILDTTNESIPVTMTLILNVSAHIIDLSNGSNPYGHVTIDDVSFARGVYFLGARHGKHNRLMIFRKSDNALIMDVGQGVALLSRASLDLMEGSISVQRIFNYSGGLLSAIAGDEPVKDPTKITFRYDPQ